MTQEEALKKIQEEHPAFTETSIQMQKDGEDLVDFLKLLEVYD